MLRFYFSQLLVCVTLLTNAAAPSKAIALDPEFSIDALEIEREWAGPFELRRNIDGRKMSLTVVADDDFGIAVGKVAFTDGIMQQPGFIRERVRVCYEKGEGAALHFVTRANCLRWDSVDQLRVYEEIDIRPSGLYGNGVGMSVQSVRKFLNSYELNVGPKLGELRDGLHVFHYKLGDRSTIEIQSEKSGRLISLHASMRVLGDTDISIERSKDGAIVIMHRSSSADGSRKRVVETSMRPTQTADPDLRIRSLKDFIASCPLGTRINYPEHSASEDRYVGGEIGRFEHLLRRSAWELRRDLQRVDERK